MSTVKSKKLQVGTDATSSNNFTIYQPATPDGTLRIGVGNADSPTEVGRFTSAGYKPATAPAFQAWLSANQALSINAWNKVTFDTTEFDTTNDFDTVNYRYIPSVAGYYQINMAIGRSVSTGSYLAALYKNGSEYTRGDYTNADSFGVTASMLVYLNGTTDYIEAYVYSGATAGNIWGIQQRTHFDGFLVQQA